MIQAGLASVTFRRFSPAEVVKVAERAGLRGVEWAGDTHVLPGAIREAIRVREMTMNAGLQVVSYGSYYVAGDDRATPTTFERVLDTAVALGAPNIRVWAGRVDGSCATDLQKRAVVDDLRRICDLAGKCEVRISTEFHSETLSSTAEQTCWLLEQVARPNFRTYWQPATTKSFSECLDELEKLSPRLENLHVFHWLGAKQERRLLSEAASVWKRYLALATARASDCRFALLEFVEGDSLDALWSDARTLRSCLTGISP